MLTVQMKKFLNRLIGEDIVVAHLVQETTMDFDSFCENVAHGTAVSAAAQRTEGTYFSLQTLINHIQQCMGCILREVSW